MSFGQHTPESLVIKADSRNPTNTCRGLTTAGRPCRRALAASVARSPTSSTYTQGKGAVPMLHNEDVAALFCWQHKDQAELLVASLQKPAQGLSLKQKSSIDTLIERIGVLDLEDEVGSSNVGIILQEQVHTLKGRNHYSTNPRRPRDTMPQGRHRTQRPLVSVPEDMVEVQHFQKTHGPTRRQRRRSVDRTSRSTAKTSWLCCTGLDDDDLPAPRQSQSRHGGQRPARMREAHRRPMSKETTTRMQEFHNTSLSSDRSDFRLQDHRKARQAAEAVASYSDDHLHNRDSTRTKLPIHKQPSAATSPPNSQTGSYLSLIPPHLSPSITSALLNELSKPISAADEAGYIYIFWLTPETDTSRPDEETATSLLDYDDLSPRLSSTRSRRSRDDMNCDGYKRAGDSQDARRNNIHALTTQALQRFASISRGPAESKKILLKIGRASNVHRRLSQWTKQCGQNITLIRYYPYVPQRSVPTENGASEKAIMVPHVHRVERLIHVELAEQRVAGKGKCEQCGREHKEWFEVEATRNGVRAVDEVVRRWVSWSQRMEA